MVDEVDLPWPADWQILSDCLSTFCAASEELPAGTTTVVCPLGLTQFTVQTYC